MTDRQELIRRFEERLARATTPSLDELLGLPIFAGIPEKARPKVLEKATKYLNWVSFDEGDEVLREGDYSDSAYYIADGNVEVLLGGEPGRGRASMRGPQRQAEPPSAIGAMAAHGMSRSALGFSGTVILDASALGGALAAKPGGPITLAPGEVFGEMAALSRYPVSATVIARSTVRLLQIRLPGLRMLLSTSKELKKQIDDRYRQRALGALLHTVPLFASLDSAVIEQLKVEAELVSYSPGADIVEEGAPADALYVVRGGFVKMSVRAGSSNLAVTYLRTGDYAGEAAVLGDVPWPFRLQALDHVEAVKIPLDRIREILAAHPAAKDLMWDAAVKRLKARGAALEDPVSAQHVQMAMDTGLIHGESVLLIDLSTCVHCDECVRGCADAHGGTPRFVREGQTYRNWLIPTACYQCTDPVCMIDCPTGAISRSLGTLEVTINAPDHPARPCIGCGKCASSCPWQNIVMVETGETRSDGRPVEQATKCDLCHDRPAGPACVQMCPHGCATRVAFKDLAKIARTLS